jgi:hypothetical protein
MASPTSHRKFASALASGVVCASALRNLALGILGVCGRNRHVDRKNQHVDPKIPHVDFCDRRVDFSFSHVESAGTRSNPRINTLIAKINMWNFRFDALNLQNDMLNGRIDVLIFRINTSNAKNNMSNPPIDISNLAINMSNSPINMSNWHQDTSLRALRPRIGKNGFLFFGRKPRSFGYNTRIADHVVLARDEVVSRADTVGKGRVPLYPEEMRLAFLARHRASDVARLPTRVSSLRAARALTGRATAQVYLSRRTDGLTGFAVEGERRAARRPVRRRSSLAGAAEISRSCGLAIDRCMWAVGLSCG